MSNLISNEALAKIAIAKNVIKEYRSKESDRTVYLKDGTEFQIYLKNPYPYHVGIQIYVNDKSIGNMLVLRPGQSHWLDRFMDSDDKFLFSTYSVDDTPEMQYATSKNGKVRIEFHKEKEEKPLYTNYPKLTWQNETDPNDFYVRDYTFNNSISCGCNLNSSLNTVSSTMMDIDGVISKLSFSKQNFDIDKTTTRSANTNKIETGRIEKGSKSDQRFKKCDLDFEYSPFETENILILPSSRKQVRPEDTRRKYCSQCGKKVSPKDKYCSNCGAKLQ